MTNLITTDIMIRSLRLVRGILADDDAARERVLDEVGCPAHMREFVVALAAFGAVRFGLLEPGHDLTAIDRKITTLLETVYAAGGNTE